MVCCASLIFNSSNSIKKSELTCAERTTESISHIWKNHPEQIPTKYTKLEYDFINTPLSVRTSGNCNNKRFICEMGQPRYLCDPCATAKAHKKAMDLHISDSIQTKCTAK